MPTIDEAVVARRQEQQRAQECNERTAKRLHEMHLTESLVLATASLEIDDSTVIADARSALKLSRDDYELIRGRLGGSRTIIFHNLHYRLGEDVNLVQLETERPEIVAFKGLLAQIAMSRDQVQEMGRQLRAQFGPQA